MNYSNEPPDFLLLEGVFLPFCNSCDSQKSSPGYKEYNLVMTGILLPLIGFLGIIGNALSAFVYTRPSMRNNSMNIYLSALAVSDICVITTAFFLFFMEGMRRYDPGIAYVFGAGAPYFFPTGVAAQTCSVYFTVAAGLDCFLQVVLPSRFSARWCTVRRTLVVIAVIVFLSIVYNIAHCFEVKVESCWDFNFNVTSLQVCMTDFRMDMVYMEIYYVYLYTIVMAAGPLIILLFLNSAIIITLWYKKRKRRTGAQEADDESTDVITLILVVFLFIFCNSLALIINFLETGLHESLGDTLNYLVDVSNLLVVGNSSANFLFYYKFGESFRRTLNFYMRKKGHRNTRNSKVKSNGTNPNPVLLEDLDCDGKGALLAEHNSVSCPPSSRYSPPLFSPEDIAVHVYTF